MYVMHPSFWGKLIIYFQSKIELIELGCLCNWLNYTQKKKKKKKKKKIVGCVPHMGSSSHLIVITHLMCLSLKSSCQPCLLTRFDTKCVGHAERRRKIGWRKHKNIWPSEEKNWIHHFCLISCTEVPIRKTEDSAILKICVSERK